MNPAVILSEVRTLVGGHIGALKTVEANDPSAESSAVPFFIL
jgi:hypothetical protein